MKTLTLNLFAALAVLLLGCPPADTTPDELPDDDDSEQLADAIIELQAEVDENTTWRESADEPLSFLITEVAAQKSRIAVLETSMAQAAADSATALATALDARATAEDAEAGVAGFNGSLSTIDGQLLVMDTEITQNWITAGNAATQAVIAEGVADNAATLSQTAQTTAAGAAAAAGVAQTTAGQGVVAASAAQGDATQALADAAGALSAAQGAQGTADAAQTAAGAAQADATANAGEVTTLQTAVTNAQADANLALTQIASALASTSTALSPATVNYGQSCSLIGVGANGSPNGQNVSYSRILGAGVHFPARSLTGFQALGANDGDGVVCGSSTSGTGAGADFDPGYLPFLLTEVSTGDVYALDALNGSSLTWFTLASSTSLSF